MIAKQLMAALIFISALVQLRCTAQATGQFEPVALIELFTSEGCSSCPPADKLLAATLQNADASGSKIFGLAFHVDYWNRLGWKDSFSTKQYTDRQAMYVTGLGLNGAYTPQMVVNGTTEFVGSDKASLNKALLKALNTKSAAGFTLLKAVPNGDKLSVSYALKGDIGGSQIHVALVTLHASTDVKSGENRGLQLQHTHVVRQFVSAKALLSGNIELPNIPPAQPANCLVIAYVQQDGNLRITAAASVQPNR